MILEIIEVQGTKEFDIVTGSMKQESSGWGVRI